MNVLVTELFGQKAPSPQEVDNLRLLGVKLRGGGTCLEVVRQPGHAAPRVTGHIIVKLRANSERKVKTRP